MSTRANQIVRYYDEHQPEGKELTQSFLHYIAVEYLLPLLTWLFRGQDVGVAGNVNFYQTEHPKETPKSPDVVAVDGLVLKGRSSDAPPSYYVGKDGPPPRVAFEISSRDTWLNDLRDKPAEYEAMGVLEYIAFDPNLPGYWTKEWRKQNRLIGWRLDAAGHYQLIPKDPAGRLWSQQLNSWLVVDETLLRLYTADGQLRLTEAEAQAARAETAEQQQARTETQKNQAEQTAKLRGQQLETERRQTLIERQRAEVAEQQQNMLEQQAALQSQQLEIERRQTEIERQRAEVAERARVEAEQQAALQSQQLEIERQRAEALEKAREEIEAERAKLAERLRQLDPNAEV